MLDLFLLRLHEAKLPAPELEYAFAPGRKYRADYAWPAHKLLVERDGGIWRGQGAHSGGKAILRDMAKGNVAQLLGFLFLRFTTAELDRGTAVDLIAARLRGEGRQAPDGPIKTRQARGFPVGRAPEKPSS